MRILMLVGAVAPTSEVHYAINLGEGVMCRGHSLTIYTRDAKIVDKMFHNHGIGIRHLPLVPFYTLQAARQLARDLVNEPEPCVVICQSTLTAGVALLARRILRGADMRIVMTVHRMHLPGANILNRFLYSSLSAMIFSSAAARDKFKQEWRRPPVPPERIHVVRNSLFKAPHDVPEAEKGPRIAIYNGAVRAGRGLELLITALRHLKGKKVRLLIAGRGNPDYADTLRRLAINEGVMDMITWKINASEQERRLLITQSHFGVFPFDADDAFGYANLELMSARRAQIATATPISTEYMGRGSCIYVNPNDDKAFADAIGNLAADASLRGSLASQALRRYEEMCRYEDFLHRTIAVLSEK